MIRKILPLFLYLLISCSNEPSVKDIEKALEWRYRWFGDVVEVRVISMVKLNEDTYFAQVKYGIKFKKSLRELEEEINRKLREADIYRNFSLFVNIVYLNELVSRCGRFAIEEGRVCYITKNLELKNIRGEWVVRFM